MSTITSEASSTVSTLTSTASSVISSRTSKAGPATTSTISVFSSPTLSATALSSSNATGSSSISSSSAPTIASPTFSPFPLPSTITATVSVEATETVIHQVDNPRQGSQSGLNAIQIVSISVGSFLLLLIFVAAIAYGVFRCHRRRQSQRQNDRPSDDIDTVEKYRGGSEYSTPYLQYRQVSSESRGTALLLDTPSDRSRSNSPYIDAGRFRDRPPSPFVNGEDDITHAPLTHAVSLADATPFGLLEDAQLDTAVFLPSNHSLSKAPVQLPPISIPEYVPPSRRSTKGTRSSRRNTKHTYKPLGAGDDSDGDSVSLYSQASAYTSRSAGPTPELTPSDTRYPLTAIPLVSHSSEHNRLDSAATITAGDRTINRHSAPVAPIFSPPIPPDVAADEEGITPLSRENTVFVANLLKSRVKHIQAPSRSSSLVSHIERKGSIKPAFSPVGEDGLETRRVRALPSLRKPHDPASSTSAVLPETSSQVPFGTALPEH
ncbi:hypothetical protein BDZ97DRAFT_1402863 [Flammula alnicola]|nr:hypothetical protein BDZ97DRAFT_1402863 [Flammula alnicola]